MAILGIIVVIAVVGLILLFKGGTGQGVYGGEMYQSWSDPLRQPGEEVGRYTSPVPATEGGTYYRHRPSLEGLQRDICPEAPYTVVFNVAQVGARDDCILSPTQSPYICCPPSGQAGQLKGAYD